MAFDNKQEEIITNRAEQYQMNGAFVGIIVGLIGGMILLEGLGGGIAGGVVGLFGGAVLGMVIGKLSPRAGKVLLGAIVLVVVVVLAQNIFENLLSPSVPDTGFEGLPYDEEYYEMNR